MIDKNIDDHHNDQAFFQAWQDEQRKSDGDSYLHPLQSVGAA